MSETYEICCKTCKSYLWIGQGHAPNFNLYKGQPKVMVALEKFLNEHLTTVSSGIHEILILETQNVEDDWVEIEVDE